MKIRLIIFSLILIQALQAEDSGKSLRTNEVRSSVERCMPQYHPNCVRIINQFKLTIGTDLHWQTDTFMKTFIPYANPTLLSFRSDYTRMGDSSDIVPMFAVSGRQCDQIDNLELSYRTRTGNSSIYEQHRPSLTISFSDNQCNINEALIRPMNGDLRRLTRDTCLRTNIDISQYGIGLFDACQILYDINVPTSSINFAGLEGSRPVDCVDCSVNYNILIQDMHSFASDIRYVREVFDREQGIKRNSQYTQASLDRIREVLRTSTSSSDIGRAYMELINLMPYDPALELLLSSPSLNSSDLVLAEYARALSLLYTHPSDRFGSLAYPERAYVNRRRVYESFSGLLDRPNLSHNLASHLLYEGLGLISASNYVAFEFDRLSARLLPLTTTVGSRSLNDIHAKPINFISSALESFARRDTKLSPAQLSVVETMFRNMLPRVSSFDKDSLHRGINELLLNNYLRSSSDQTLSAIITSDTFRPGNFNPSVHRSILVEIQGQARSGDAAVRERARQVLQYLQIPIN